MRPFSSSSTNKIVPVEALAIAVGAGVGLEKLRRAAER
jgi:hypothetical protein